MSVMLGNVIDALTSAPPSAAAEAAAKGLGRFGKALLLLFVTYVVGNGATFCSAAACQVRGALQRWKSCES